MDTSWISAIASACSALVAAFTAGRASREMSRWRSQKRETKNAEVAGEVLVATLRYLTALSSTTSLFSTAVPTEDDPGGQKASRTESEGRWAAIAPFQNDFIKAWELAETYLPDDVDKLLDRVWGERATILSAQQTFFHVPLGTGAEPFKEGFGSAPYKRIAALRDEARRILRPLAQLSDEKSESRRAEAERQLESPKVRALQSRK